MYLIVNFTQYDIRINEEINFNNILSNDLYKKYIINDIDANEYKFVNCTHNMTKCNCIHIIKTDYNESIIDVINKSTIAVIISNKNITGCLKEKITNKVRAIFLSNTKYCVYILKNLISVCEQESVNSIKK